MLIALITMMLLGGGSAGLLGYIAEARGNVRTVMERDDRRKAALDTLKDMKKRTNARDKQVKKSSKELTKALSQSEINDADLDAIWDRYIAEVNQHNYDMLDLRFQLKDQLTREEWQKVFPIDLDVADTASTPYEQDVTR